MPHPESDEPDESYRPPQVIQDIEESLAPYIPKPEGNEELEFDNLPDVAKGKVNRLISEWRIELRERFGREPLDYEVEDATYESFRNRLVARDSESQNDTTHHTRERNQEEEEPLGVKVNDVTERHISWKASETDKLSSEVRGETDQEKAAREAVWKHKDGDQPVVITGEAGEKDGRRYVNVEGSKTAIPEDEVTYQGKVEEEDREDQIVAKEPAQEEPRPPDDLPKEKAEEEAPSVPPPFLSPKSSPPPPPPRKPPRGGKPEEPDEGDQGSKDDSNGKDNGERQTDSQEEIDTAVETELEDARKRLVSAAVKSINSLGMGKGRAEAKTAQKAYEKVYIKVLEIRLNALGKSNLISAPDDETLARFAAASNANERALLSDMRLRAGDNSKIGKFLDKYRQMSTLRKFGVGAAVGAATGAATVLGAPLLVAGGIGVATRGGLGFGSRWRKKNSQPADSFGTRLDVKKARDSIEARYGVSIKDEGIKPGNVARGVNWVDYETSKQRYVAAEVAGTTVLAIAAGRYLGDHVADWVDDNVFGGGGEVSEYDANGDGHIEPEEVREHLQELKDSDPDSHIEQTAIDRIQTPEDVEALFTWKDATEQVAQQQNITVDEASEKLAAHLQGVEQHGEAAVTQYYDSLEAVHIPDYPDGVNFPIDAVTYDAGSDIYTVTGVSGSRVSHMTGAAEAAYQDYFANMNQTHQANETEIHELVNELIKDRKKKGLSLLLRQGEQMGISRAQIEAALARASG